MLANYEQVTGQAKNVAATPYQAYGGELVSPINGQQSAGIGAVNQASGIQNPYNTGATGLASASSGAIDPTVLDGAAIQKYESPYQSDVIAATQAEIQNQNQQQAAALQGNTIASGAFGGDRAGIAQAALAGQQDIANNATIANLYNQNYSQALATAQQQQGVGLEAQQNTAARQLAASQQLGTLGNTAQTEALNEANAQTNAGTLQQTTQQAQDTAAYNQFLQQAAYPFETTGWLANIVEGIGSQSGGSSTGTTTTEGNAGSAILGGLLGLGSFLLPKARGGRVQHRAQGGGIASAIPYDPTGIAGGAYVPTVGPLAVGNTMPKGSQQSSNPSSQSPQQQGQDIAQTAKAVQGLGNAFVNSSLGDTVSDALQDSPLGGLLGGGFSRGGGIAGRRHYDGGGIVPDGNPEDILLDPNVTAGAPAFVPGSTSIETPTPAPAAAPSPSGIFVPIQPRGPTLTAAGFMPGAAPATGIAAGAAPSASTGGQPADSGVDSIFTRMIGQESGYKQFNPDNSVVTSPKGAIGIAQIMPGTGPEAAAYAGLPWDPGRLASDPAYNLALGHAYYQHQLQTFGSPALAAAAYNAGPGAVQQALRDAQQNGGSPFHYLPGETQDYVSRVTSPGLSSSGASGLASAANGTPEPLGQVSGAGISAGSSVSGGDTILGIPVSSDARQMMLMAGLGIMGGTSMNPWVNIGQGGLKGIAAVNQNRTTQADVGLKSAQAQQVTTETQLKQQQLQLMMKALQNNQQIFSQPNAQPGAPAVTSPTVTAPTVTGSVAQPPAAAPVAGNAAPAPATSQTSAVTPQYDPARLRAAAENMAFVNPAVAQNYRDQAEAIESGKAQVQFQDGHWGFFNPQAQVNLAGQTTAAQKAAELQYAAPIASAQAAAKANYDLVEVQPQAGGPTHYVPRSQVLSNGATPIGIGAGSPPGGAANAIAADNPAIAKQPDFYGKRQEMIATNENDMIGQMQARQLSKQRLQTLQGIMQTFQPGAFAQQKADLVANMRAIGIPVPDSATANPAAFQEFTKNAIANVFNDVKTQGGRVLVSEIEGLTKANANPELQPAAAAAIIGQGLGILNYEDQHATDYFDWKKRNPNAVDTSGFEIPWLQSHPVSQFVGQANKGIAYSGQEVPPTQKRVNGQTYMTPKGPFVWQGNGWAAAPQTAAP